MTPAQRAREQVRWKRLFAVAAFLLVLCLLPWVARVPLGKAQSVLHVAAGLCVAACLHAAKKLRDLERAEAGANAAWLNDAHAKLGSGDDTADLADD